MYNEEDERVDPKSLPIFKKGKEIYELVRLIADLIPEENEYLCSVKEHMLADAMLPSVKIAGAEGADIYDLKMEAAAIIRKAARDLTVQNHSLEMFGFKELEYYELVRNLIEEYRMLFIKWVESFDQWNYHIDRWGLFNPPGVGPFDKDPDEDIPFDPNNFCL